MLARWFLVGGAFAAFGLAVGFGSVGCGGDDPAPAQTTEDAGTDSGSNGQQQSEAGTDAGQTFDGVPITYGACPAFTGCGGDVVGSRSVVGGCLSDTAFDALKQGACSGIEEREIQILAKGSYDATASSIERTLEIKLSGKAFVPRTCVDSFGFPGAPCSLLGPALTQGVGGQKVFDTASCATTTTPAEGCDCTVGRTVKQSGAAAYTVTGNVLTTTSPDDAPSERTYEYCVEGDDLTFRETTAQSLPIVVELSK